MVKYAHRKIGEDILDIDAIPPNGHDFAQWTLAGRHLDLLMRNGESEELIVYASGPYSYIHSLAVPNSSLSPLNKGDLLAWSCNPDTSIASYCSGGGRTGMWIERGDKLRGAKALRDATDLLFIRSFEGWKGDGARYVELNQEYTHLNSIHWRHEYSAYCKYDENGDLEEDVSVTMRAAGSQLSLVTFGRKHLEEYLAISGCSLVRMFDFTLVRHDSFNGWPDGPEDIHDASDSLFYRQKAMGDAAYTRGVQIIRPNRSLEDTTSTIKDRWSGRKAKQYVEFTAYDWRNRLVKKVSTDPLATTNYFEANGNRLPFELSPAFFRPEVLSKYKTDREKYTIEERGIQCRSAWYLKGYDVNDAGQVHAYICDLRRLPYSEQLHWLSYNEEPKASISHRAFTNDFEGEFVSYLSPREEVMSIVRRWKKDKVGWWQLRDPDLLDRANQPLTASQDEWSEAHMDLSKLIVEGFQLKFIRAALDGASIKYVTSEQSIGLLEKLAVHHGDLEATAQFVGLRTVQRIRSKVKGHSGSSEAKQIVHEAISKHGSFAENFKYVCTLVASELGIVEGLFA
ncbi:hypothetical protein [Phenylobacterium sp.]|uniref:hypothetical protein n=1 Tax=Phenylobacterium sp. TaxID=1871053 RepID=UPI0035ADCC38